MKFYTCNLISWVGIAPGATHYRAEVREMIPNATWREREATKAVVKRQMSDVEWARFLNDERRDARERGVEFRPHLYDDAERETDRWDDYETAAKKAAEFVQERADQEEEGAPFILVEGDFLNPNHVLGSRGVPDATLGRLKAIKADYEKAYGAGLSPRKPDGVKAAEQEWSLIIGEMGYRA